jgi:hypothetical protein
MATSLQLARAQLQTFNAGNRSCETIARSLPGKTLANT